MSNDRMALRAFRHLVMDLFGLEFTPANLGELQSALQRGLEEHHLKTLEALFYLLEEEDPAGVSWRPVRERLTVGETFFLRDPAQLEAIRSQVLLPIARQDPPRHVRLWSAGCSTGEEAYTLAATALEIFPEAEGWHVDVLGTDIHEGALAHAKRGIYREWSFRGVPPGFREQWFQEAKGQWHLHPFLRRHVHFRLHNLVQDPFEPLVGEGFDLVLCRNVFIYFPLPQRIRIAQAFVKSLRPRGALILGHSELGPDAACFFRVENHPDSILIRPEGPEAPPPALSLAAQLCPLILDTKPRPHVKVKSHPAVPHCINKKTFNTSAETVPPPQEETVFLGIQGLANQGRLAEAEIMLSASLDRSPFSVRLNYLNSLLASEQGQPAETLKSLDRVLYLDPHHVAARMDRAHLFGIQNCIPEALKDLDHAIEVLGRMDGQDPVPDLEPFLCEDVLARCKELRERCRLAGIGRAAV